MSKAHRPQTASAVEPGIEDVVLPHLDAAYRLARWRLGNEHDAEDVVQDAFLRALRYFGTFTGGNGRAWFLKIVSNTCYDWLGRGANVPIESFDEAQHSEARPESSPEALLLHASDLSALERAIGGLSDHLREVLVLRELEGLSYQELAEVLDVPVGTVMSRLSRARRALGGRLAEQLAAV
jgi:RNA polymerase sigma-70 factor (ECF subfamily)